MILYGDFRSQTSEDDLKLLFQLCSEIQGYSRMKAFGKVMLEELEQGGKLALALMHPFEGNCIPIQLPIAAILVDAAGGSAPGRR